MPPRKRSTVIVEETFPSDLDSDSDDDDRVCLDIGKQAARDMLSDRTRESYSASMRRMISWTLKQNSALPKHKQFRTTVPFSYNLVTTYMAELKERKVKWPYDSTRTKHYSPSSILSVVCCIKDAYRLEDVPIQEQIEVFLNNFYKSYCMFIGKQKMQGLYPCQAGRSAISIPAFKMISRKLYEMQGGGHWKQQLDVWPLWNMLGTTCSRVERQGDVLVPHLALKEDMITCDLSTSKTDPTGRMSYPKCMASNPYEPYSDVFLGLALLFFCRNSESGNRVFSHTGMPAVATHHLRKVLDALTEQEEIVLAVSKDLVGLHSPKKTGCSKLYDNECTVSVAIEKRCDHNLLGSQGSYVGDLPANDAFNARILAGLKFGTEEFACKPCHFDELPDELSASIPWPQIIAGYLDFPATAKAVMPILLATVVHHEIFIRSTLRGGGGHPILFSSLFTSYQDIFEKLRPYVKFGLCKSEMTVTGVPLASKTYASVDRIDRRLELIEKSLQRLGVLPVRVPEAVSTTCSACDQKLDQILKAIEKMSVTSTGNEHVVLKADAAFKHWPIGYLPSDYRLPSLSIEQLWRAWFTPSSSSPALMGICGKMLPAGEDANVRVNEIRQLSRYTNVIKAIKGRMEVSSDQVMASFKVAWNECCEIGKRHDIVLGSEHQNAGTFYNVICRNLEMKEELTSSSRPKPVVNAQEVAVSAHGSGNGIFFSAALANLRAMPANELSDLRKRSETKETLTKRSETAAKALQFKDYKVPRISVKDAWNIGWCKSEGNPDPLMTLKAMWMSTLERGPLWRTQDSLLAIRAELPETEITHQNCDRLFVEGFSLLKQRHALLNITENVSASALSNILTEKKIYSHRKLRRVAAVAAVPSTAIRPAAVAATPPAPKRHADTASRSAMPPSKNARII